MSQLTVIFLLNLLVGIGALLFICGGLRTWRVLLLVPLSVTAAAVTYSLTRFLTVVCRNGRGAGLGLPAAAQPILERTDA